MDYNKKEKEAIVGVLSAIMYADGLIDSKEVDCLSRVKYDLGIADDSIIAGQEMDPREAFNVISAMGDDKKKEVTGMLMRMVYSDTELNVDEYTLFVGLAEKCGLKVE